MSQPTNRYHLTPYDEFPVHQSPYPFCVVPSTDYNWDDGYWMGVHSPAHRIFIGTGLRVNPNSDMVGAYAWINVEGMQRTIRLSRCWRENYALQVGPLRYEFLEPLRKIRIVLEPNEADFSFDIIWEGSSPPFLETHHVAVHRCRHTTEQSRYTQPGRASGQLTYKGKTISLSQDHWYGTRDHSWGLYAERPPLSPQPRLLPPRVASNEPARALRFWAVMRADPYSGVFEFHEDKNGIQTAMNDAFGTPFGGTFHRGWSEEEIPLASATHRLEFEPGTKILKRASISLIDTRNRPWKAEFETATPPWLPVTNGYLPGSWKDGGTIHTYHNAPLAIEWDEFDFSKQPVMHKPYALKEEDATDTFRFNFDYNKPMQGIEYSCRLKLQSPDGATYPGAAHVEHLIVGPYAPYGFTGDE